MFPNGSEQLDTIAGLLAQPPAPGRAAELFTAMREFSAAVGVKSNDGEAPEASKEPGMLDKQQDPDDVFTRFADRLADAGVEFGDGGGEAGLGDFASKLLHGAKEALRQLTYWQMKNRAGVVGQKGVGPAIDRLADEFPNLRIHLIGHSFGARVVSFALAGMRESAPSPVKSVTLLQGAYSRFAFAPDLPFGGQGALEGKLARIDGPLTVCFSSHDRALGVFYPLASAAAGDATAGVEDPLARYRAMGQLGAFNVELANARRGRHKLSVQGRGDTQLGCLRCRHRGRLPVGSTQRHFPPTAHLGGRRGRWPKNRVAVFGCAPIDPEGRSRRLNFACA